MIIIIFVCTQNRKINIKFTLICIKILPHCSFYLLIQILHFRLIRKVIHPSPQRADGSEHKLHGKLESSPN